MSGDLSVLPRVVVEKLSIEDLKKVAELIRARRDYSHIVKAVIPSAIDSASTKPVKLDPPKERLSNPVRRNEVLRDLLTRDIPIVGLGSSRSSGTLTVSPGSDTFTATSDEPSSEDTIIDQPQAPPKFASSSKNRVRMSGISLAESVIGASCQSPRPSRSSTPVLEPPDVKYTVEVVVRKLINNVLVSEENDKAGRNKTALNPFAAETLQEYLKKSQGLKVGFLDKASPAVHAAFNPKKNVISVEATQQLLQKMPNTYDAIAPKKTKTPEWISEDITALRKRITKPKVANRKSSDLSLTNLTKKPFQGSLKCINSDSRREAGWNRLKARAAFRRCLPTCPDDSFRILGSTFTSKVVTLNAAKYASQAIGNLSERQKIFSQYHAEFRLNTFHHRDKFELYSLIYKRPRMPDASTVMDSQLLLDIRKTIALELKNAVQLKALEIGLRREQRKLRLQLETLKVKIESSHSKTALPTTRLPKVSRDGSQKLTPSNGKDRTASPGERIPAKLSFPITFKEGGVSVMSDVPVRCCFLVSDR